MHSAESLRGLGCSYFEPGGTIVTTDAGGTEKCLPADRSGYTKVNGRDDEISDIDILVLTSRSISWQEKSRIVRLLSMLGRQFDVLFDPIVHSLEEWEHGIPSHFPIHREVEDEGVLVA